MPLSNNAHSLWQISRIIYKDLHTNVSHKQRCSHDWWLCLPVDWRIDNRHVFPPVSPDDTLPTLGQGWIDRWLYMFVLKRRGVGICLIPLSVGSLARQLLPHLLPCWMCARWALPTTHRHFFFFFQPQCYFSYSHKQLLILWHFCNTFGQIPLNHRLALCRNEVIV